MPISPVRAQCGAQQVQQSAPSMVTTRIGAVSPSACLRSGRPSSAASDA